MPAVWPAAVEFALLRPAHRVIASEAREFDMPRQDLPRRGEGSLEFSRSWGEPMDLQLFLVVLGLFMLLLIASLLQPVARRLNLDRKSVV